MSESVETIQAIHDTVHQLKRTEKATSITHERLKSLVARIESRDNDRKEAAEDIADIYKEAKSAGFDIKAMRRLVADRKKDESEIEQLESLLDTYRRMMDV